MNITKEQIKEWLKQNNYITSDDLILDMIHDCIQDLAPKWASVEDELPEYNESVRFWPMLAIHANWDAHARELFWDTQERIFTRGHGDEQKVTHWTPLPSPPNETLGQ